MTDPTRAWGQWGPIVFDRLLTFPVEESSYLVEWRMAAVPLVHEPIWFQGMGRGPETYKLRAGISKKRSGDHRYVDLLRAQGDMLFPQLLILQPSGEVKGRFFLLKIRAHSEQLIGGSDSMFMTVDMEFLRQGDP